MSIVAKNVRPMSNDVHSMSNDVNIDVQRSPGSVYLELIQYHFVNKSLIKIGIISTPIFVKHKRYPSPLSQVGGKSPSAAGVIASVVQVSIRGTWVDS